MKPSVYSYVSATQYLNDLLKHYRGRGTHSLRSWAKEIRITPAYLCYILKGQRPIRGKVLGKIISRIDLSPQEKHFFIQIAHYQFEEKSTKKEKLLLELGQARNFRRSRPRDSLLAEYLSDPLAVFLREACALRDFKKDIETLQKMFWFPVSKHEIKKKLNFLIKNGFVSVDEDGKLKPLEVSIDCSADVLRTSMSRFHRRMFAIAAEAIHSLDRTRRNLLGLVTPVSHRQFLSIHQVISETMKKIEQITLSEEPKTLLAYVGLSTFQLSSILPQGGSA